MPGSPEESVGPPSSDEAPAAGVAGAGARKMHARRKADREARVRARHPHTAGLRLALGTEPQHEAAWRTGAVGEELVAASLETRCSERVRFLHDRSIPDSRANIDHIAIAPSGVWVIDAKNLKGKVRIERSRKDGERLLIDGRNRTKLVDGMDRQVACVRAAVEVIDPTVCVNGAFCFIDTDLPLFRQLNVRGYPLRWRKGMAKLLNADGPIPPERISLLARGLAERLPAHR